MRVSFFHGSAGARTPVLIASPFLNPSQTRWHWTVKALLILHSGIDHELTEACSTAPGASVHNGHLELLISLKKNCWQTTGHDNDVMKRIKQSDMTNGLVMESPSWDLAFSFAATLISLQNTSALFLVDHLILYCGVSTFTGIPQQLSHYILKQLPVMF